MRSLGKKYQLLYSNNVLLRVKIGTKHFCLIGIQHAAAAAYILLDDNVMEGNWVKAKEHFEKAQSSLKRI